MLFSGVAARVHAVSDNQREAIDQLGQLNGIALQCKYHDEAKRIKQSLIVSLPKKRGLGDLFEEATERSFMAFIKEARRCPEKPDFVVQVDNAIGGLRSAFSHE